MSDKTAPPVVGLAAAPRLEPDAVSVAQDTLIGLADTGPTVSVSFTLVLLIAATAYAGPAVLVLTAIPRLMLAGTLFGTLTPVTALGPSVLAVFNSSANSKWPNIAIATGLVAVMLII